MEKHTISEPALDNEEGKAMEDKHDSLREFIASECKEQLQKHVSIACKATCSYSISGSF